ncbi:hypothetical protein [Variovorax sp. PCZ-1]|uniref:hypothetical protein n=1 Tax=Variovorax sp. PCZ-1 TaxID=2835533 RepID=UPI001BCCC3E8|nr:hypothetical protein [Variovorax sp. PCZ-1]MBS7808274.1 hypothetical protein [Variovorax sp. PCZ-1]
MLQLLGVIVVLAAIAPVAMAGGNMIAAFMAGRNIVQWLSITVLCMLAVVGSGMLALRVVLPMLSGMALLAPLVSALVLLAPPWAIWIAGKRWMEKKVSQ